MMPSTKRRVKYQRHRFPVHLDSVLVSHAIRIVWDSEYKTVYKHALDITLSIAYEIAAQLRRQISLRHVLKLLRALPLVLNHTSSARKATPKPPRLVAAPASRFSFSSVSIHGA
jgi:hypothetical protein